MVAPRSPHDHPTIDAMWSHQGPPTEATCQHDATGHALVAPWSPHRHAMVAPRASARPTFLGGQNGQLVTAPGPSMVAILSFRGRPVAALRFSTSPRYRLGEVSQPAVPHIWPAQSPRLPTKNKATQRADKIGKPFFKPTPQLVSSAKHWPTSDLAMVAPRSPHDHPAVDAIWSNHGPASTRRHRPSPGRPMVATPSRRHPAGFRQARVIS